MRAREEMPLRDITLENVTVDEVTGNDFIMQQHGKCHFQKRHSERKSVPSPNPCRSDFAHAVSNNGAQFYCCDQLNLYTYDMLIYRSNIM